MATYAEQQAESLLKYYQGMGGTMREPSALASAEEREAFAAQEARAGRAPMEMLPEAYGGRPTGASRRSMRMQAAWDEARKQQLEEQRMARQMEMENRRMALQEMDQQLKEEDRLIRMETERGKQEIKANLDRNVFGLSQAINGNLVNEEGKVMPKLDPDSPDYLANKARYASMFGAAFGDDRIKPLIDSLDAMYEANKATGKIATSQDKDFFTTQQSLLESGVPQEKLSEYYDPKAPAGVTRFDQDAVSKQLGATKFQEEEAAKEKEKEAPKNKINFDLRQAYGELNELLLSGEATESARAKVAGLRERYKAVTGEEAPEVLPRPTSGEQYDRLPDGTPYIGKDGKIKNKTAKIKRKK